MRPKILLLSFLALAQAITLQPQAAISTDSEGWTVITPSEDSRIVYVSNSEGNNSNDGLSPSTPKKTITAGNALIRDGYPDHLLLKRGDVFPPEADNLLGRWKNGRSADEPVVLSFYGDSGDRPVVKISNQILAHNGESRNFQAFVGIEIYKSVADPDSPDFTNTSGAGGMPFIGGGSHILIEDCRLRFMSLTVQSTFGAMGHQYTHFRFRRNLVTDSWRHTSSTSHETGRVQGMYGQGLGAGYVIEENFFDHCGWNENIPGAGANMYNHNVYLNYDCEAGGIIRGNIFSRGSAQGLQARAGGLVDRNLFVLNSVAFNMGYNVTAPTDPNVFTFPNRAKENIVLNGRRQDPNKQSEPQSGAVWGIWCTSNLPGVLVEDNIVANRRDNGGNTAFVDVGTAIMVNNISYAWSPQQDTFSSSWPHPSHDLGHYYASIGGDNDTIAYLNWMRSRPLRTLPWDMTAYAAINYIREGFNKPAVEGYYIYEGMVIVPVTSVSISPATATIEGKGGQQQLTANVVPANASDREVFWSTSDDSVATVDASGLVTSVSAGTVTITATTRDGGHTGTRTVTVQQVAATGITVEPGSTQLVKGSVFQLTASIEPANTTAEPVTWSSSNPLVATVDADGLVIANLTGAATITAATGGIEADATITVTRALKTNYALEVSVTTTSEDGTEVGAKLVDGNLSSDESRWSAEGYPQSATLDLGAVYNLDEFRIYPHESRAYKYVIQTSTNDTQYQVAVSRLNNAEGGPVLIDTITARQARYVRLSVTGATGYTGPWVSIAEFEVFGTAAQVWAGFQTEQNWTAESVDGFGWLFVDQDPWVYSDTLADWLFVPEHHYNAEGSWSFGYLPEVLHPAYEGSTDWFYSESLHAWIYAPFYGSDAAAEQWFCLFFGSD